MRDFVGLALIGAALACSGLSVPAHGAKVVDPDPFRVAPDSLTKRHAVIAVGRVFAIGAARLPVPDKDTPFGEEIRERLVGAGFAVAPPETVLAGWKAAAASVGGVFDLRSGRPDTTRWRAACERMSQWLSDSLGCDLWLRYEMATTLADYDQGRVTWDGTTAEIGGPGVLQTLLLGAQSGRVPALSLQVTIVDRDRAELYVRRAGLQTTQHMVKNRWVDTPIENLREPGLAVRALDRALGPWVERVAPRPKAAQ